MPFKRVKLVTISPSQIHPTLLPLTMLNCSFIVSVHYSGGGGGGEVSFGSSYVFRNKFPV